ncbi:MAG: peptidoglycan-binding protein [Clostridia bacterium]|nr:peptidoglycan-binding protein [Clostridia bacterium]
MFKATELVSFCLSMVGMPYWYGTCVYNCTTSLLNRKAKQYSSHYGSSRMSKYKDAISKKLVCMDCVGMIKGFFWTNGGIGVKEAIGTGKSISSKYGSNGCPDKSANGMLSWCKSKGAEHGKIATLPDVPGVLLFSSGHVGVYIGGGEAVEARGFNYGVVKTKVSARSWTDWAYLPSSILEYDTVDKSTTQTEPEKVYKLGDRVISRGVEGADVAELQSALISLGYDLGTYGEKKDGVDGDCGSKTVSAIKEFQEKYNLNPTGKYDDDCHKMLQSVLSGEDQRVVFQIRVTGGSVNVRTAPDTSTKKNIVRVVRKNNKLDAIDVDASTGWYKLADGNYISNKYAERV